MQRTVRCMQSDHSAQNMRQVKTDTCEAACIPSTDTSCYQLKEDADNDAASRHHMKLSTLHFLNLCISYHVHTDFGSLTNLKSFAKTTDLIKQAY
jgi:hypothetical protein